MSLYEWKDGEIQPAKITFEEELDFVNHRLSQAKNQEDAKKRGFVTTCEFFDKSELYRRKMDLERFVEMKRG